MRIQARTTQDQKTEEHSSKTNKGCKHIKKPMGIPSKNKKITKNTMSIAMKTKKVYKHIKKPMSIPAKTQKYQKKQEHSSENEKGVQTH